ncbi:MAG: hypothetical protein ACAF42_13950 [Limnothrix sp. BL-A-16]
MNTSHRVDRVRLRWLIVLTPTHPDKGFKPLAPAIEQRQRDRLDRVDRVRLRWLIVLTPTHPNKGFKPLVPTIEQRQRDRLDRLDRLQSSP